MPGPWRIIAGAACAAAIGSAIGFLWLFSPIIGVSRHGALDAMSVPMGAIEEYQGIPAFTVDPAKVESADYMGMRAEMDSSAEGGYVFYYYYLLKSKERYALMGIERGKGLGDEMERTDLAVRPIGDATPFMQEIQAGAKQRGIDVAIVIGHAS